MLEIKKYLPVGSVVLLKNGIKKVTIIGIMQNITNKDGEVREYDYIGVFYPEGFLTMETMFMLLVHQPKKEIIG